MLSRKLSRVSGVRDRDHLRVDCAWLHKKPCEGSFADPPSGDPARDPPTTMCP